MSRAASRLPELGPRGEGWVVLQVLLAGAVVVVAKLGPRWPAGVATSLDVVGGVLLASAAAMLVLGARALGRSFTPMPRPRERGRLAESGILGLVRHPLYGGGILFALGLPLVGSPLALLPAALLIAVLDLKARREEAWLEERYAGYEAYRLRTPHRFVPWLF